MVRRAVLVATILVLGLTGACGQTAPGGSGPMASTAAGTTITITRTGGIAGVHQSLVVAPDGSWSYSASKAGSEQHGQLTDDQQATLLSAVTDPGFADQTRQRDNSAVCSDAFTYQISVSGESLVFPDCPPVSRPLVDQAMRILHDATPF